MKRRLSGSAVKRLVPLAVLLLCAIPRAVATAQPLNRSTAESNRSTAQDSIGRLRIPTVVQERTRTDSLDNAVLVQALEKRLRCTCGCNLDVFTCRTTDFTCTTSPALHADVLARLRADGGGMTQASAERVVDAFVAQYGLSILMQPPKSGFNWSAYVTPFVALFVGLSVLAMLMRRWTRADKRMSGSAVGSGAEATAQPLNRLTAADAERLRRALESVDS